MNIESTCRVWSSIIITSVLLVGGMRPAFAEDTVGCTVNVTSGIPQGVNPIPYVGQVVNMSLDKTYRVAWCNCLADPPKFTVISASGQQAIGQTCNEGCDVQVDNSANPKRCDPVFGNPNSTSTSWSVTTTNRLVSAGIDTCTDGEEFGWVFCARDYLDVTACQSLNPVTHSYTQPSSCCSTASNNQIQLNEPQVTSALYVVAEDDAVIGLESEFYACSREMGRAAHRFRSLSVWRCSVAKASEHSTTVAAL